MMRVKKPGPVLNELCAGTSCYMKRKVRIILSVNSILLFSRPDRLSRPRILTYSHREGTTCHQSDLKLIIVGSRSQHCLGLYITNCLILCHLLPQHLAVQWLNSILSQSAFIIDPIGQDIRPARVQAGVTSLQGPVAHPSDCLAIIWGSHNS